MTDTVGQDCRTHASSVVATKIVRLSCLHHPVIKRKAASKHSCVGSLDIFNGHTSVLETFVYDLKQFALLGVHICGFDIVDAKKTVFKFAQIFVYEVAAVLS